MKISVSFCCPSLSLTTNLQSFCTTFSVRIGIIETLYSSRLSQMITSSLDDNKSLVRFDSRVNIELRIKQPKINHIHAGRFVMDIPHLRRILVFFILLFVHCRRCTRVDSIDHDSSEEFGSPEQPAIANEYVSYKNNDSRIRLREFINSLTMTQDALKGGALKELR